MLITMSESLKSWLFPFCTTHASLASTLSLDLPDLPFHRGNRIQLLHLLTFPSASNSDIFALVGDRTHCIAARFSSTSLHHFHSTHSLPFTALKGALLTLTNVRITVDRVRVAAGAAGGKVYRDGQWGLVLDVRGWEVVGGMGEGVWFGGVRLVTSSNGVPRSKEVQEKDEMDKFAIMIGWMKRWVRYKLAVDRAEQHKRYKSTQDSGKQKGTGDFPTPAQRGILLTPPQPQPNLERKTQEESLESIPTQPSNDTAAHLWTDFDLDADPGGVQEIALDQWKEGLPEDTTSPAAGDENAAVQQISVRSSSQPRSDEDPDESGISDYEREARSSRRRKKRARSTTAAAAEDVEVVVVEEQSAAEKVAERTRDEHGDEEGQRAVEEHVVQQVNGEAVSIPAAMGIAPTQTTPATPSLPITPAPPQSTPTPPQNTTSSTHPPPSSSSTTHLRPPRKRKTRQAAIAALMAQIVD
ncbi:Telomere replication protein EST3 [Pseudozyma hubeiensis]|nr:Telomere replication protein EST3 [Pseudozyma hubeiensis]